MSTALPDASYSLLVSRTTQGPVAHECTANEDDAGEHHGALDANEVPCYLALYWHSRRARRTVHVGTYKLNLRRLAKSGFAREEGTKKIRLRFVRDPSGTVALQKNASRPELPVGLAQFS